MQLHFGVVVVIVVVVIVVVVVIFTIFVPDKEKIRILSSTELEELEKPWELVFGTLKP